MVCSMTAKAQSINTVINDNVTYKAGYGGKASVVSSPKAKGEVTILDKVTINKQELKVTRIDAKAFKGNEDITGITLPSTIETIGDNAFLMCRNLKNMNIPQSVTSIGSQAFRQTAFEAEANGLLYVDNWLVGYGFTEADSPQGNGKKMVMMMEPIGDVEVREGTTGIALGAFDYCEQITSLVIPASVTYINFPICRGCKSLDTITVHPDNITFDSRNNCNAIIKTDRLMAGCRTTVIPDGVVDIADKAFDTCVGLTSITFPSTVQSIGDLAFNNCANLKEFSIPETVTQVYNATFANTGWFKEQPDGLVSKDGWLLGWKGQRPSDKMVVPTGTRNIASYAFMKCSDLKEVVLPAGLQRIEWGAFMRCSNLKNIAFPEGVKRISGQAFYGCTSLKKINIPSSVEDVTLSSFSGTAWYTNLSDGAVYLDGWLLGVNGKKPKGKLTIKDGTKHISTNALSGSNELTSVVLPSSITTIGYQAFMRCVKLESVIIPEGVEQIGDFCFYQCKKISDLHIPASVTKVGASILLGTAWFDAQPGNSPIYLDGWLLEWKGNIHEVYKMDIQPGTKGIAKYALSHADNLSTVTIPSSMQYINASAFRACDKLIQVNISDLDAWKRISFYNEDSNPTKFSHSLTVNGQTITSW